VKSIIVDAGPLIALFRRRDAHHRRIKEFVASNPARLIATLAVVTEVCQFLNARGKIAFLTWIKRGGLFIQPIAADDFDQLIPVIERYADRDIDFADASLIWLADRSNTAEVMTIDRTDFTAYRLSSGKPFDLILA
jgi:uncharacterized protein